MIKVAHVCDGVGLSSFGIGEYIKALFLWLQSDSTSVTLHTRMNVYGYSQAELASALIQEEGRLGKWSIFRVLSVFFVLRRNRCDVIHAHGIWSPMSLIRCGASVKFVSPHGMLSKEALAIKSTRKRLYLNLIFKLFLRKDDIFHVTSKAEAEAVRSAGFKNPIFILPGGIGWEVYKPVQLTERLRRVVYIGRITPIKGLEGLLDAWCRISGFYPNWELVIMGPGDRHYLQNLKKRVQNASSRNISFRNPLYGDEKFRFLRKCSLFVLPSHSENFGFTVLEALSSGVPVISSKGTPWESLVDAGVGWHVANDKDTLFGALAVALELGLDGLHQMGLSASIWSNANFQWQSLAEEMAECYEWSKRGGAVPNRLVRE